MSHWSTVYAGDASRIAEILNSEADVAAAPFVIGAVELYGIHELDLELLMQTIDGGSITFESFVEERFVDTDDFVAYRMKPEWVAFFARLDDTGAADVVPRWLAQLAGDSDAAAAVESVRALAALCRRARERGAGVVYSWNA